MSGGVEAGSSNWVSGCAIVTLARSLRANLLLISQKN